MSEPIRDNEAVYDAEINPLMTQIIAICKAHGIPMVASFEYAPDQLCTTFILPKGAAPELKGAAAVIRTPRNPLVALTITKGGPA